MPQPPGIGDPRLRVKGDREEPPRDWADCKFELALAGHLETNCRLEHVVTSSFLHKERVLLRDFAEAADGPSARARRADISVRWRAGRARAERRPHRKHGLEGKRPHGRTCLRDA